MDANTEAKPRVYSREEYNAEVLLAQESAKVICAALPAAAVLYDHAYGPVMPGMTDSLVADRVFELALALATRLQQHTALDVARLTQAKEDSGL
jgi:hypothetical protein